MRPANRRPAFTLLEMLAVVGLVLILATIVLAVNVRTSDQRKVARGAEQLQGWLLIAKQRAIRDRAPRGVPLNGAGQVTELVYIERPEPWTSTLMGLLTVPAWSQDLLNQLPPGDPRKSYSNILIPGAGANWRNHAFIQNPSNLPVSAGDILEIMEPPSVHVIFSMNPSASGNVSPADKLWYQPPTMPPPTPAAPCNFLLTLMTIVPGTTQTPDKDAQQNWIPFRTTNYRITRQPQPLVGEAPLELAKEVVINMGRSGVMPISGTSNFGSGPVDILFDANGRIMGTNNNVILWLEQDPNLPGAGTTAPQLIVIYSRTGLIGTHPVDMSNPPTSFYSFTQDGQSSGL